MDELIFPNMYGCFMNNKYQCTRLKICGTQFKATHISVAVGFLISSFGLCQSGNAAIKSCNCQIRLCVAMWNSQLRTLSRFNRLLKVEGMGLFYFWI